MTGGARSGRAQPVAAPADANLLFLRGRDADARLRALEAERVAARPILGALAAALVASRGWRAVGLRSLADYARERLGLGARAVSEWARVWRALEELPRLREAVLTGELSWTVARLVVRVATPATEAACLASVRGRTVRAVETMLRAVEAPGAEVGEPGSERIAPGCDADADPPDAEDEARVALRVSCPREVGGMWNAAVELARRVAGEPLPVWACAEAIAAEVASALPLASQPCRPDAAQAGTGRGPASRRLPSRRRFGGGGESGLRHVAFPHVSWRRPMPPARRGGGDGGGALGALRLGRLAEGVAGCGPHELDRRLRTVVAALQRTDLELGRLLRQVVDRRLYRELGFASFERYVAERLETSPRTARRLVRLARAERRAPRVADAFRQGRVSAFQAEVLLRVVAGRDAAPGPLSSRGGPERSDAESRWLALAERVTLRRLEAEASAEPRTVVAFHAPPDVAALFAGVLERVRAGLGGHAPPWVALAAMLHHAIETWTEIGTRFRDYADFERDGYRCTVPGCTARRDLQSHHVRFRSAGGPDVPANRTTLCWFHHHLGVHRGSVRISGRAPDGLRFVLGARSDGPPLVRYRSGDVLELAGASS